MLTQQPRRAPPGAEASRGSLRVLVVDDHPVVCEGVRALLRAETGIEVVGSAGTGRSSAELAAECRPDVVLLDLRLPDMLASEAATLLRHAWPPAKIILFTAYAEHAGLRVALDAGVDGCVLKDALTTDLARTVRAVAAGERVIDPRLVARPEAGMQDRLTGAGLTTREYEVLRLVATGRTNQEIAASLYLAANTVKTYLQSVMLKLGAHNRVEAVSKARQMLLL